VNRGDETNKEEGDEEFCKEKETNRWRSQGEGKKEKDEEELKMRSSIREERG
jgi:hypothetical protein